MVILFSPFFVWGGRVAWRAGRLRGSAGQRLRGHLGLPPPGGRQPPRPKPPAQCAAAGGLAGRLLRGPGGRHRGDVGLGQAGRRAQNPRGVLSSRLLSAFGGGPSETRGVPSRF